MELCSAVVRHAGNLGMTIHKEKLPPAEIVLLRAVHGPTAIVNVTVTHTGARRDNAKELVRLRETYGRVLFEKVYPGIAPQLPVTMAEAGISEDVEAPDTSPDDTAEDGERVVIPGVAPPPDVVDKIRAARRAAVNPSASDLVG